MKRDSGFFGDRPGIIYITETVCLSDYASSDVAGSLWMGVRDMCPEHGCDLLALGGDYRQNGTKSMAHLLLTGASADGFLAWRSRSETDCAPYFQRFASKPLVYLTNAHTERPVEKIVDGPGLRELLRHLVVQHGCRRIAFICGPEHHSAAMQRLNAYKDELRAQGIAIDPRLITPYAGWSNAAGRDGVRVLLDERQLQPGVDLDAIMCVSDLLALGAMAELTRRQIQIPEQIKLTGVNNAGEARTSLISLATVGMPFSQQSRRGMQRLLHLMQLGQDVVPGFEPQGHVIAGESCGCGNPYVAQLYSGRPVTAVHTCGPEDAAFLREQLINHLHQDMHHQEASAIADQLLSVLREVLHTGELDKVLRLVKPYVRTGYLGLKDQAFWQSYWGAWRGQLASTFTDPAALVQAGYRMDTLRQATADIYTREQARTSFREGLINNLLRVFSTELSLAKDMPVFLKLLEQILPELDVHSCWLVTYDQPGVLTEAPAEVRLLLAIEDGVRYTLPPQGLVFASHQLVPRGFRRAKNPGVFVGFPVMQREFEYGYLIFNHSTGTHWGETLAAQIGGALRSLRLREELANSYQDLVDAQKRLVEADKMAALGELVAGVAHEINTPLGIGVTAVSTVLDDANHLAELVRNRQAKGLPALIDSLQEAAAVALRNMERAAQLVESFKMIAVDQTRAESRTINLDHYLHDVVRNLMPRLRPAGHRVVIDCPDTIEVTCDPSIIARIVTNLIVNSLLHGFEGRRDGAIRLQCRQSAHDILLEYSDNGIGMPQDVLDKIFHPFFTTKRGRGGTGLGMHIVYNLVTQGLHGDIRCDSTPGAGIHFQLCFPV